MFSYLLHVAWMTSWTNTRFDGNLRHHNAIATSLKCSVRAQAHRDRGRCVISPGNPLSKKHAIQLSAPIAWWRHQMETLSALLVLCAGNSPTTGEFLTQKPVTRSFHVFFHLRLNKRLSKQSWGWWFATSSRSLWRHCNGPKKSYR